MHRACGNFPAVHFVRLFTAASVSSSLPSPASRAVLAFLTGAWVCSRKTFGDSAAGVSTLVAFFSGSFALEQPAAPAHQIKDRIAIPAKIRLMAASSLLQ